MAKTDTVVTTMLLTAYCPRLPSSHARDQFPKSMEVGRLNGESKIWPWVLNDDSIIQTSGTRKTNEAIDIRT